MKVIGVNGSPRKNGNSAALLEKVLEGARAAGAETERIDIYPLNFKGCRSCFACKRKGPFYGQGCAMKDDLTDVINRLMAADAWAFASPIYNGDISSAMSALLERVYFPYHNYDGPWRLESLKKLYPSVFLYSLNGTPPFVEKMGVESPCKYRGMLFSTVFGPSRYMFAYNTLQFDDYSKYHTAVIPVDRKMAWHEERWPKELEQAFNMGRSLVEPVDGKDG